MPTWHPLFFTDLIMKICSHCQQTKALIDFPKNAQTKDGYGYICKKCAVKSITERQRTLLGLVKKIYHNQRMTTKKAGRPLPTYTEQELFDWMLTQGYESLWKTWVASGYNKWLSPSIDRKDNTISYTLSNIQLITWRENLDNQKQQNRKGIYLHTNSKAVDQLTLTGEYIQTFASAAIAAREMVGHNRNISNITAVCNGKWKSAYGFKWRFTEDAHKALC